MKTNTDKNTTFIITGGAGRVVTAIPALEKYQLLNPNDDFRVLVHSWENVFWSHPTLQHRVFGAHQKGNFDTHVKHNRVIVPEPYVEHGFFNQEIGLVDAFDLIINHTGDHADLHRHDFLYLTDIEIERSREIIKQYRDAKKKRRVIVFQPYGSGVEIINQKPLDRSNRSMRMGDYFELVKLLSKEAVIIYASLPQFRHPNDDITISFDEHQPYLRVLMGLISQCDYFVGVCSVGQHIARAFRKPGTVIMGATSDVNYSYANHFDIFRKKDRVPVYTPWRLSEPDCEFADRVNQGIMDFDHTEITNLSDMILHNINQETPCDESGNKLSGIRYD
jgi:hypothetical protein